MMQQQFVGFRLKVRIDRMYTERGMWCAVYEQHTCVDVICRLLPACFMASADLSSHPSL